LAVEQAPGQRVMLAGERAWTVTGLADPGQRGGAVAGDLPGQRGRVHGRVAMADRLAHQLLHRGDGLGCLADPAPLASPGGVGDGLQFPQGVRTAKLVAGGGIGVVGRPGVITATPAYEGKMPIDSIAFLPRWGWAVSRVYLPVRAQCTQASRPSTRNPVSSTPATSLATIAWRIRSVNSPSLPAARAVTVATVPDDTGTPNSSASACAVRFLDRNCPM
jgi:hypothetical protein